MTYSQLPEEQLVLSIFQRGWKGPDMFGYSNEILFFKKGSYVEMSGTMIKINK